MKYALAGLAIAAALAALFFRPPNGDPLATATPSPEVTAPTTLLERATERAAARDRAPAARRIVVYVAGEVITPGVYTLAANERAQAAVARAGGPKPDADLVAVNLAAPLEDGEEVAVPKIGAETRSGRRSSRPRIHGAHPSRGNRHRRQEAPVAAVGSQSIDLNSADASELQTLPGIGPALAARIVEYRETNGPFRSVDELADISGITPALQEKMADFVTVR